MPHIEYKDHGNSHRAQWVNIPHETLREMLELFENSLLRIKTVQTTLPITRILDALDNEFLLSELLGHKIEISIKGRQKIFPVSSDKPEYSLTLACIEILMAGECAPLASCIKQQLFPKTRH